ncbi:MAG: hypothetical protein F4Z31_05335 [Gemmatimonadetes bacterium]|nr:hypothetical protein [Gemmatimonadota bacterium]
MTVQTLQNPTGDARSAGLAGAIRHAPEPVRQRLVEMNSRPLVSLGHHHPQGRWTSWRVGPRKCWNYPSLQIGSTPTAYTAVVIDVDNPEQLQAAIERAHVPPPSWTVTRVDSGNKHAVWCLARPVLRGTDALSGPLEWFQAIRAAMIAAVGGDPGYTGNLTHNPSPAEPLLGWGLSTEWGPERPYTLGELAAGLSVPSGQPYRPAAADDDLAAAGRNTSLFEALMRWAGLRSNLDRPVLDYALAWDSEHNCPRLPRPEVEAVARSVDKIRARWASRAAADPSSWHRPDWLARCRHNGHKGGIASGQARRDATAPRDARIALLASQGLSRRKIAARVGLSVGGVCYILNRPPPTQLRPPNTDAEHLQSPRAAKPRELFPRYGPYRPVDARENLEISLNKYATAQQRQGERRTAGFKHKTPAPRPGVDSENRLAPPPNEKHAPNQPPKPGHSPPEQRRDPPGDPP